MRFVIDGNDDGIVDIAEARRRREEKAQPKEDERRMGRVFVRDDRVVYDPGGEWDVELIMTRENAQKLGHALLSQANYIPQPMRPANDKPKCPGCADDLQLTRSGKIAKHTRLEAWPNGIRYWKRGMGACPAGGRTPSAYQKLLAKQRPLRSV